MPEDTGQPSLKLSTTRRCNQVAVSPASGPSAPLPSSSRPPSRFAVFEPRVNATANNAHPLTPRHPVDPQSTTGRLVTDRVTGNVGGKPPLASRPLTRPGVGGSNLAQNIAGSRPIAQYSAHLPSPPDPPDSNHLQQPLYKNPRMFDNAHCFTITGGTFIAGDVTYHNATSTQFMEKLLEETILGAEFDSSSRDPPPRCHPGTRLDVLERCLYFISHCSGVKKMRWVFGAAGVGKSAIMQSVAEYPELPVSLRVSIFFTINGRDDGTKAILTLCYQFAAKSDSYRQIIEQEITRDPSLLRSSMAKQFKRFIVEPFIYHDQLKSTGRVLVIIDGLDECKEHRTQQELLRLISDHCLVYPSSPLVWLIASRPEPHITSFLSRRSVIPAHEKEDLPIDSDEARADVERFLREKLTEIKEGSDSLDSHWPEERDFWKLAGAAGGLFAYAQTAINYIGDSRIGSPVSQLSDVLHVIDKHPMTSRAKEDHPMALLDVLYSHILSNVPCKIMANARKILLALATSWIVGLHLTLVHNFITVCNLLGMTADEAYAALNHLRSVLCVPPRDKAGENMIRIFHKSFIDYICDFSRSGLFPDIHDEVIRLWNQCTSRILNEVPDGIELGIYEGALDHGQMASRSANRDKISLTWPVEDGSRWTDSLTRLHMYDMMVKWVLIRASHGDQTFQSELCIRFLTIAFDGYYHRFPYNELHDVVFDPSRHDEFMMHGILKRMPLKAISVGLFCDISDSTHIKLLLRHPATTGTTFSDPWNSSCQVSGVGLITTAETLKSMQHKRESKWEAGKSRGWMTTFEGDPIGSMTPRGIVCQFCFRRLGHQLENWKDGSPDTALVMFTSARNCCVQVTLVDPQDGVSEWVYSFWHYIPWEEREKYGGAIYCTESLRNQMIKRAAVVGRGKRSKLR